MSVHTHAPSPESGSSPPTPASRAHTEPLKDPSERLGFDPTTPASGSPIFSPPGTRPFAPATPSPVPQVQAQAAPTASVPRVNIATIPIFPTPAAPLEQTESHPETGKQGKHFAGSGTSPPPPPNASQPYPGLPAAPTAEVVTTPNVPDIQCFQPPESPPASPPTSSPTASPAAPTSVPPTGTAAPTPTADPTATPAANPTADPGSQTGGSTPSGKASPPTDATAPPGTAAHAAVDGASPDAAPAASHTPEMGTDPLGGGYGHANAYENKLNDKLTQLFEQNADPAQKSRLEKMNAAADSARLSSLQFSFVPSGLGYQILQSIVPTDAVLEHIRQGTTQNAYASGASFGSASGWIAGLQTGIEFIRNYGRFVGDVVAGAGAGLGFFALASGAASLIPPLAPITAPLSAAAAIASEILAIAKAGLDLLDSQIGLLQILLSVIRARLTDDPTERARICQLLKKEADDISSALTGAVIGVASMGLGRGIGKLAGSAGEGLEGLGKMSVKQFKTMSSNMLPFYKQVAKMTVTKPMAQARQLATQLGTTYNFSYIAKQAKILAGGARQLIAPTSDKFKLSVQLMTPRLVGVNATGVGAGTTVGVGGTDVKVKNKNTGDQGPNSNTNAPTQNNAVPDDKPIEFGKVAYWPSILEKFGSTREWVHNAQERMVDQHQLAKDDLESQDGGVNKYQEIHKLAGGINKYGNRIYAAGGAEAAKAVAGQASAQQAADKAKQAEEKGQQVKTQGAGVGTKANAVKDKVDAAKATTQEKSANKDKSWFTEAKEWLWENTLGKVASGIASAQKWVNDVILKYALKAAGMDMADLDLAGIERKTLDEKAADSKAEADAKNTQAQGPEINEKIKQLKAGASTGEQNAIQGVVDALAWIQELDSWDQGLAAEQDAGASYLDQAAKVFSTQPEQQPGGSPAGISPDTLKPITSGAENLKAAAKSFTADIRKQGQAEINNLVGKIGSRYPGMPTEPASNVASRALDSLLTQGDPILKTIPTQMDVILTQAQVAITNQDYGLIPQLNLALDTEAAKLVNLRNAIFSGLDHTLQLIADEYLVYYEKQAAADDDKPTPAAANEEEPQL